MLALKSKPNLSIIWSILVATILAINDPEQSSYFIGELDMVASKVPNPFPLSYCVKEGIWSNYVKYECSDDNSTVSKYTYSTTDTDCSGALASGTDYDPNPETFTLDAGIEQGALHDFNCAGKENVMGYKSYFGGCEPTVYVGIMWSVTDVCFLYANRTNVTGNTPYYNRSHLPFNEYFLQYQILSCEGVYVYLETYIMFEDEQCTPADKPLTRGVGSPGCAVFLEDLDGGYELYVDAIACIHDGVNQFNLNETNFTYAPVTTGGSEDDVAAVKTYVIAILMSISVCLFY